MTGRHEDLPCAREVVEFVEDTCMRAFLHLTLVIRKSPSQGLARVVAALGCFYSLMWSYIHPLPSRTHIARFSQQRLP